MDENKYLLLVKGEDKTAQIQSYEFDEPYVRITYANSAKPYTYKLKDFLLLQEPIVTEPPEKAVVFHHQVPLHNVSRILDFGPKVRIVFNNGSSRVYDPTAIKMESSSIKKGTALHTLQYWSAISQNTYSTETAPNEEGFLKKQFIQLLSFVNRDSALECYLKGHPIRADQKTTYDTIFPFQFNLSQKQGLDNALRHQISIIEGPPGTGKTQTILNILANLVVMQNKTVAVVSSNNAAVQNVRDKLEEEGYHFLAAALGNNKNKAQFFADPPQPNVSGWKSECDERELLAEIRQLNKSIDHLMNMQKEKAKRKQKLSAFRLEKEHFDAYHAKQNVLQIPKLSFYRLTSERILSFLADNHEAAAGGAARGILHKLKLFFRHGFTDFKRLQDRGIDVILNFQQKYYELKVEQLSREIDSLQRELEKHSISDKLKRHQQLSEQLFRHKLYRKYHQQQPIQASANSYKRSFAKFIEQYPIMLSTTHSLRNCVPDHFMFDYVIIDESSQVDLLTGALALSCCKNVIIVGDTKQLPQIVDHSIVEKLGSAKADVGAAYDYFQHNLLSSLLALYGDAVPNVMLKEHYRCHPKIIEFCNQKYYNGELIAFTSEKEGDQPLVIYHTAAGNHMREVTHGQKGKFNQRELDVIQQEVLASLGSSARRHSDIGFTTPYRKQVEKASAQLDEEIESDTIHKYQGRQKPTMILSTVLDTTRSGQKGMEFVNDPRMVNVAVSRAEERFILVTDQSLFRNHNSEIGDLIRYMEYSTLDDNLVESEIVSVFDLLYKEYSESLRALKSKIRQHSKFDSENVMRALLSEVLQEASYTGLECGEQVLVRNLLKDLDRLDQEERQYVNRHASVDFVLYHKLNKRPVLIIEVDGFAAHENNLRQLERDRLKDRILEKYQLPLLRLPTTGSGEDRKLRNKLDELLNK